MLKRYDIAAMYYPWGASHLSGCENDHQGALIFTSTDWLKSATSNAYTKATRAATGERRMIEAFYLRANRDEFAFNEAAAKAEYRKYLKTPRDFSWILPILSQSSIKVSGQVPEKDFVFAFLSASGIGNPKQWSDSPFDPGGLWPDIGKNVIVGSVTDSWLSQHSFECGKFSVPLPSSQIFTQSRCNDAPADPAPDLDGALKLIESIQH